MCKNGSPFLSERIKVEKVQNLATNLQDKAEYVIHIRNLKQELFHELALKKYHRVIKFNQNVCLKSYIDMNTKLRKKAKNNFEKDFFKLMNNAFFGKTIKNVSKHRNIKFVTTEKKRNHFGSAPTYDTTKCFSTKTFLSIGIRKIQVLMNKPVYLGLSILDPVQL